MKEYLKALRGETLFGSVLGFLTAAALVLLVFGDLPVRLAAVSLAGLVLLHIAFNLLFYLVNKNTYPPRYPLGAEQGDIRISPFTWALVGSTALFFSLALSLGFWLAGQDRPLVLLWGFGGIAAGLIYIFMPPRCRRLGPGQIVTFLGFGPLLSMGVHYALSGIMTPASALVGLPQALLLSAVMGTDPVLMRTWTRRKSNGGKAPSGQAEEPGATLWSHLALSLLALASLVPLARVAQVGWLALIGLAAAPLGFQRGF